MPTVLKPDPQNWYKGSGSKRSRILYAVASSVKCKGDNGNGSRITRISSEVLLVPDCSSLPSPERSPRFRIRGFIGANQAR